MPAPGTSVSLFGAGGVFDALGREAGIVRSEGLVPGLRYSMRRNGELVWTLSVRSIVRKRRALELANGDSWTFNTPFFWWQWHLTGTAPRPEAAGRHRSDDGALGHVVAPGKDTFDVLAAVAFLHRQWWHW